MTPKKEQMTMKQMMSRRAVVRVPSGPASIETIDVPVVEPGPGELRVKIGAAAINPVDLGVAGGLFHQLALVDQPDYTGLGWDFAGTVEATGPGVELPGGTRVAGFIDGFDRDHGSHAEHLLVPAANVAVVPDGLDLVEAATVPLNATAAAQLVDLLGAPPNDARRLLVTGAAGAVGAYVAALAKDRSWQVTGMARAADEQFVRGLGVDFTTDLGQAWDAVADAGALQEDAFRAVREGGRFIGMQPAARLPEERGIAVEVVFARPDGALLARLLARVATGELPARVHAVAPLDEVACAYQAMAQGSIRGRIVLVP
ncbi:NADPH:quinone reductase-like Zn-dependent oxidoreductase [Nocardioides daedukensis]|uniref:NADPH:quinone reductase-like Zn-dependent oxidoreductase n=1 Tax=Nocardioides daedukensis TaxID=634462 RepID=A0A7Y9S463_9ACTN|nr:NADP-dependent oxidoreductase [Nocardioides daedukensis]NYG60709.1 NADPH:quinone reductase-like Zn-dependent oxidoreductase [Nocardioides daedukensis]